MAKNLVSQKVIMSYWQNTVATAIQNNSNYNNPIMWEHT